MYKQAFLVHCIALYCIILLFIFYIMHIYCEHSAWFFLHVDLLMFYDNIFLFDYTLVIWKSILAYMYILFGYLTTAAKNRYQLSWISLGLVQQFKVNLYY